MKDILNKKFGLLTPIRFHEQKDGRDFWFCKCACGNEKVFNGRYLRNGDTKSCGCLKNKSKYKNLINKRFGKLLVFGFKATNNDRAHWECLCDCGHSIVLTSKKLLSNNTKSCGCLKHDFKYDSLIGQKFGKLTVINFNETRWAEGKRKRAYWNCLCDCGANKVIEASCLTTGNTLSCGCYQRSKGSERSIKRFGLQPGESSFNDLYRNYKSGAKVRNIDFDLSKEEAKILFKQNCYYCGIEPSQIQKLKNRNGDFIYNGIDRIDSKFGYTTDNCVACCSKCNRAKLSMSRDDFYLWVKRTYEYLKYNNRL